MTREQASGARVRPPIPSGQRQPAGAPISVRHLNLAMIASEILSTGGGLSRADLAGRTGLTGATVSRLVRELIDLGVVTELEAESNGLMGRPGAPLFPATNTILGIGLEVNVDYIAGCAIDLSGSIVDQFYADIDQEHPAPDGVLKLLRAKTKNLIRRLRRSGAQEICGICLAIPGTIDALSQSVVYASNLGWRDVVPATTLGTLLPDVDLFSIENDANLQAITAASALANISEGSPSFLYVFGEIGVGGAIITEGRLTTGAHGWAGEIGHTTVEPDGPLCHCGSRGCLETYIGRRALLTGARLQSSAGLQDIVVELENRNPDVVATVEKAGWALGIALSNALNLIDLSDVVLGIGLSPLMPWLTPQVNRELDRRLLGRSGDSVTLHPVPITRFPSSIGGALKCLQDRMQAASLAR